MLVFIIKAMLPFSIAVILSSIRQQTSHHFGWQTPFRLRFCGEGMMTLPSKQAIPRLPLGRNSAPTLLPGGIANAVFVNYSHIPAALF